MVVSLRKWELLDIPWVAEYGNHPEIAANLRDAYPCPYTLADAEAYIRSCLNAPEDRQMPRAVLADGDLAGSIGIFRGEDVYRRSAELGYWLAKPFHGRGIMPEAVRQVCRSAFAEWDIVRIFAEPYGDNAASCRVLEKSGFTLEGVLRDSVWKNGVLRDSRMYSLLKREWDCGRSGA